MVRDNNSLMLDDRERFAHYGELMCYATRSPTERPLSNCSYGPGFPVGCYSQAQPITTSQHPDHHLAPSRQPQPQQTVPTIWAQWWRWIALRTALSTYEPLAHLHRRFGNTCQMWLPQNKPSSILMSVADTDTATLPYAGFSSLKHPAHDQFISICVFHRMTRQFQSCYRVNVRVQQGGMIIHSV